MTYDGCSLPTSEPFYGGDTWIFNSKFSSRIRDFAIQNPVSGIQNFKEVLDLPYMKEKQWS